MEEKVGTDGETERRPKGRSGWREREKRQTDEKNNERERETVVDQSCIEALIKLSNLCINTLFFILINQY